MKYKKKLKAQKV